MLGVPGEGGAWGKGSRGLAFLECRQNEWCASQMACSSPGWKTHRSLGPSSRTVQLPEFLASSYHLHKVSSSSDWMKVRDLRRLQLTPSETRGNHCHHCHISDDCLKRTTPWGCIKSTDGRGSSTQKAFIFISSTSIF